MKPLIYLDHHATTPIDPRVLEVMQAAEKTIFGNPSSAMHAYGAKAAEEVELARTKVAQLIGAQEKEIIFTSGATESNNFAIKGIAEKYADKGKHIITQVTEHKSVLEVCRYLERKGFEITYLPVNEEGMIHLEDLKRAVRKETILISIMFANNEVGTVHPIFEIGKMARELNLFFHVDAAQAVGKLPMDVGELHVHLLSFSAHKLYGPKGVGALYIRQENPRVRVEPLLHGGGQEDGYRSGTLNVPGIIGFGKACELAQKEMGTESQRIEGLRDKLFQMLQEEIPDLALQGHPFQRLAGNLNVSFPGIEGEALIRELCKELIVSTGSACIMGSAEPSYVLKALGVPEEEIHTSVRIGIGRFNTEEEIEKAAAHIISTVKRLQEISPFKGI